LLFFYVLAFGVLIGAEFNAALEETRQTAAPSSEGRMRLSRRVQSPGMDW
jgi:uncharacterized BrkB/YihY/UPF0761 family membrane protein